MTTASDTRRGVPLSAMADVVAKAKPRLTLRDAWGIATECAHEAHGIVKVRMFMSKAGFTTTSMGAYWIQRLVKTGYVEQSGLYYVVKIPLITLPKKEEIQ